MSVAPYTLRLSKKGVIPHLMRDLLSLKQAGDAGSKSGMTKLRTNVFLSRPFWTASPSPKRLPQAEQRRDRGGSAAQRHTVRPVSQIRLLSRGGRLLVSLL